MTKRWSDPAFALAGLAVGVLCAWPFAQSALAQQSAPSGGAAAAQVRAAASLRAEAASLRPASAVRPPPAHDASSQTRPLTFAASADTAVRIPGDAPPALPTRARLASARDLGRMLTITVVLKRTDQAGFNSYLRQVYDRSSPQHDRFLTQAQLADRFGPSVKEYDGVRTWLRSRAFKLVQGSANRLSLTVRGTRAAAERAFHTAIRDYRVGKRTVYANVAAPAVPRALAPHVQAVMGLSDRAEPTAVPADQFMNPGKNACQAEVPIFLTNVMNLFSAIEYLFGVVGGFIPEAPITFLLFVLIGSYCLGAASVNAGSAFVGTLLGKGVRTGRTRSVVGRDADPAQKIGLLEFDTYRPSDVTDWLNMLGIDPSIAARLHEVAVNGGVATPGAGESEVLLDIDAVLGATTAGSPSYVVYDAPQSTSFVQMFQAMIGDGDTVISNSWSQCEDQTPIADAQAIDSVLASAAASGTTVVNGTGDDGSTCLDGSANTIGVPADSPHSTAVGGTSPTFGPGLTYGHESWWDDQSATPPGGAGGFGISRDFSRPSYQNGLTSSSMRSVPDLSFDADPSAGIELCQADAGGCPDGLLWGGTSMAAPAVAALVADLNESLGHDVGDLNAALYPLADTSAFHSAASMGSDFAHVGLGSPNFTAIYQYLTGTTTGTVSASTSQAFGLGQPQADGSQQGLVRVDLEDSNGFPVGGKSVTLTPNVGSSAVVSPSSATTNATDGAAAFTVTDTTPETVTFTAKDATDGVTLSTQPTLTFVTPAATGASIVASPTDVSNDGTSQATVSVYLQNALGRPAVGKTVSLSENGGNATITPGSGQTVTDSAGYATFTATDISQQSVAFSATDVTDGNLPVPGSATVTFEPGGSSPCSDAAPTAASGYSISPFVSGLAYNAQQETFGSFTLLPCSGPGSPAFNSSGVAYVPDLISGQIYTFGSSGGTAGPPTALPDTSFQPAQLGPLAFDKSGNLYAGLFSTSDSFSFPELVQVDPTTGATERVIANTASGMLPCPSIAVDPLSGDVFSDDGCTGYLASNELTRVSNPQSATPTVSDYADLGGQSGGMAFAPDGTLYVAVRGNDTVMSVTGTNATQPATVSTVATLPNSPSSVAIAATNTSGQATALYVGDYSGNITRIDLTQDPATTSTVATSNGGAVVGSAVGPDGCLYANGTSTLLKVTGPGCSEANAGPQISLQESGSQTPPTGSPVGFTATLENFPSVSGTPVHFTITGPNLGEKLADANGAGQAAVAYAGVFQGVDTVTASAVVNGAVISSAPVQVHWTAGKATTFLDLNPSQPGGIVGHRATITADLFDVTQSPPAPVAGAPVTLALGASSCQTSTTSAGIASCALMPRTVGLLYVAASYAGDGIHTGALSTNEFDSFKAVRPQLTRFKLTPRRFRAARRGRGLTAAGALGPVVSVATTARARKRQPPPTGTTITYIDSLPAKTTLTVLKAEAGVRKGRRCVARPRHAKKHAKKHAKHCVRYVVVDRFSHADRAGTFSKAAAGVRKGKRCIAPPSHKARGKHKSKPKRCTRYVQVPTTISFNGRLRSRKLAPGSYRLQAVASIDGLTSKTVKVSFTVVR